MRLPRCPEHLTPAAAREWRRVVGALRESGVFTSFDRAALAAYCQAYGRWVEAEDRLREAQLLYKTPSGYVQQHVLHATAPDGSKVESPACLVVEVREGRIRRLDEYLDSAAIAPLLRR